MTEDIESIAQSIRTEADALTLIASLRQRFGMVGADLSSERLVEIVDDVVGEQHDPLSAYADRWPEAQNLLSDLVPGITEQVAEQSSFLVQGEMASTAAEKVISCIPDLVELQILAHKEDEPCSFHFFTDVDGEEVEVASATHADLLDGHAWASSMRGKPVALLGDEGFQLNPRAPGDAVITGHIVGIPQVGETQEICFRSR